MAAVKSKAVLKVAGGPGSRLVPYRITRHAKQRFMERVGARSIADAEVQIEALVEGQRFTEKLPRWAVYLRRRNPHVLGVVHATVWRKDRRLRDGWEREVKLAFPVVYRGGSYFLITCVIKRGTRERVAP